ncbi:MAG: hypothetical protein K8S00_11400 [Bacteroidales bacterium]|nr:hypothetical protein [Bacteroidales bacterium]
MKTTILILLALITLNTNSAITNIPEEEFFLEEENYIDDIPFDTWNVAMNYESYWGSLGILLEEEKYVEDIPFNTCEIAANYKMKQIMAVEFSMEEEAEINDLPFDTKFIAQKLNDSENISTNHNLSTTEDSPVQSTTDYTQVQSSSNFKTYIVGILLIIIMSAYSMTSFLL